MVCVLCFRDGIEFPGESVALDEFVHVDGLISGRSAGREAPLQK